MMNTECPMMNEEGPGLPARVGQARPGTAFRAEGPDFSVHHSAFTIHHCLS